jgi:DMSO/TMAO reductase YedYZ molybdopterin-dependent catalytic subunit
MNRREFLMPLALAATVWRAARAQQPSDARIQAIDFSSLQELLTPNDEFFVRNHFVAPQLSLPGWRLLITGKVRSALELSYAEILSRFHEQRTVTLECAGNAVGSGGVSTATWEGIPLGTLLEEAGVGPDVSYIRLIGADQGIEPPLHAPFSFVRSIPLEKALHPDTLLAFRMNGEALPVGHGYPLRAIVPGWYGMDSVKWLIRIEALDRQDEGFYMMQRYRAVRLQTIGSEQYPITRMRVKSQIAHPKQREILMRGTHLIRGAAWAGENRVAKVQVSINEGKDWKVASLESEPRPYVWLFWNYRWDVSMPGVYTVVSRAIDDRGEMQPRARDSDRFDSYEQNWYHSVECQIR